jgi:Chromatin-associated proteins containing the HMG domain
MRPPKTKKRNNNSNNGSSRDHYYFKKPPSIDPNAPKPSCSALELYTQSLLPQGSATTTTTRKRQIKHYKDMFESLPTQEQDFWHMASYKDKSRYLSQLSTYVPPLGYDARGHLMSKSFHRLVQERSKRDCNAPKRAATPFSLFAQQMAPVLAKECAAASGKSVTTQACILYKALDDDEMARLKELSDLDVERYNKEMEEYLPPPGFTMYGKKESLLSKRQPNNNNKKRVYHPRPALYFYKYAHVLNYFDKNRHLTEREMNPILKEKWLELSQEEKMPYYEVAEQDRVRFEFEKEQLKRLQEVEQQQQQQQQQEEKEDLEYLQKQEDLEEDILRHLSKSNQSHTQQSTRERYELWSTRILYLSGYFFGSDARVSVETRKLYIPFCISIHLLLYMYNSN